MTHRWPSKPGGGGFEPGLGIRSSNEACEITCDMAMVKLLQVSTMTRSGNWKLKVRAQTLKQRFMGSNLAKSVNYYGHSKF